MDLESLLGKNKFLITDYAVVGIFLGVLLLFGLYHFAFPSGRPGPDQHLLGGRLTRTAPVAVSTAMLYFSALSIIENPADIYYNGIESFMYTIILVAFLSVSAILFLPMIHKLQITSIFQYIGIRFDSPTLRRISSLVYILHSGCLVCIILITSSMAMQRHFGVPLVTSIVGIGAFAGFGVTLGGLNAIVWTQVFNFHWMTIFLLVVSLVAASKAGGFIHAFQLAEEHDRLKLFNFSVNPFERHNFYNFLFGYGFMVLTDIAYNQSLVLRYSSRPTPRGGLKSIIMSVPLLTLPSLFCLLIGIFLQASYAGCDPLTLAKIEQPQDVIPHFVKTSMFFIPGIRGFFIATILGSSISVCSSCLISVSACAYQDFISKVGCGSKMNKSFESATCSRVISFILSTMTVTLAILIVEFSWIGKLQMFLKNVNLQIFSAALTGPLAALLLMAMFFPCINKYGASMGFLSGIACMGYLSAKVILSPVQNDLLSTPSLPPIKGDCLDALELNQTFFRFIPWHPKDALVFDPETINTITDEIVSLSYLLIAPLGALITLLVSFPISILTGGLCLCASRKVPATLLHPTLKFSDCCIDSEKRQLDHAISRRYVDRINSVHNLFTGSTTRLDKKPPSYKYSSVPNSPS